MKRGLLAAGAVLLLFVPSAQAGSSAEIFGVVREMSEDGQSSLPSSGVTVQALRQPENVQEGSTVTPGAEFSFNVDAGAYHVTYVKDGFSTQCLPATAVNGQSTEMPTVTLYRTSHADTASGTVTNSFTGLPIENATVEAHIPNSCAPSAPAQSTSAAGSYSFGTLPAHPQYYFTFSAPGYNSQTIENQTLFDSPLVVNAALVAVDSTPPSVSIDKVTVRRRKAKVLFSGSDAEPSTPPVTFACALDGEPALECAEKVVYRGLDKGKHKVTVTATDGNANSASAKQRFRIK